MEINDEQFVRLMYPQFKDWIKRKKGYHTADGIDLIHLWYEYLRSLAI